MIPPVAITRPPNMPLWATCLVLLCTVSVTCTKLRVGFLSCERNRFAAEDALGEVATKWPDLFEGDFAIVREGSCSESAVSTAVSDILDNQVHVILGGDSDLVSRTAHQKAAIASVPLVGFGGSSPVLDDPSKFPFFVRPAPSSLAEVPALEATVLHHGWHRLGVLYEQQEDWREMATSVTRRLQERLSYNFVLVESFPAHNKTPLQEMQRFFSRMYHMKGRVVVLLGSRNFAHFALNATVGLDVRGMAWLLNSEALGGYSVQSRVLDGAVGLMWDVPESPQLGNLVARPPNRTSPAPVSSLWAYDAMWAIGHGVRQSFQKQGNVPQGAELMDALRNTAFEGLMGPVDLRSTQRDTRFAILNVQTQIVRKVAVFEWGTLKILQQTWYWPGGEAKPPSSKQYFVGMFCNFREKGVDCKGGATAIPWVNDEDMLGGGDFISQEGLDFATGTGLDDEALSRLTNKTPIALVGGVSSSVAVQLNNLGLDTPLYGIPVVAGDLASSAVASTSKFPWLVRTMRPIPPTVVIAQLITAFGWRHVDFVWRTPPPAWHEVDALENALHAHGVHTTRVPVTDRFSYSDHIQKTVRERIVIVWAKNTFAELQSLSSAHLVVVNPWVDFSIVPQREREWFPVLGLRNAVPDTKPRRDMTVALQRYLSPEDAKAAIEDPDTGFIFDTTLLLVKALRTIRAQNKALTNTQLMATIRATTLSGASGTIVFPATGDRRNDRMPQANDKFLIVDYAKDILHGYGFLDHGNASITDFPGEGVPLSCPRGTRGVLQPDGLRFSCVPCPLGTYADHFDSRECIPCTPNAFCPFASPVPYQGHQWRVENKVVSPAVGRTGITDRLVLGFFVTGVSASLVLVGAVFLFLTAPCLARKRPQFLSLLRSCDVFFRLVHGEEARVPLTSFGTPLGGVMSVGFSIGAVLIVLFEVLSSVVTVDRQVFVTPGLVDFQPKYSHVHLTLYIVGVDRGEEVCPLLCSHAKSDPAMMQDLRCQPSSDRGGCRLDVLLQEPGKIQVPNTFQLEFVLPQTRLHSWQWELHSSWVRDASEYSYKSSGNITAAEGVFIGDPPSSVLFELVAASVPSKSKVVQSEGFHSGYVPYAAKVQAGGHSGPTYFDHTGRFQSCLVLKFNVPNKIDVYSDTKQVDPLQAAANATFLVSALYSLLLPMFFLMEYLFQHSVHLDNLVVRYQERRTRMFQHIHEMEGTTSIIDLKKKCLMGAGVAVLGCLALFGAPDSGRSSREFESVPAKIHSGMSFLESRVPPGAFEPRAPPGGFGSKQMQPRAASPNNATYRVLSASPSAAADVYPHNDTLTRDEGRYLDIGLLWNDRMVRSLALNAIRDLNAAQLLKPQQELRLKLALFDNCSLSMGQSAGIRFADAGVVAVIGGGCSSTSEAVYSQIAPHFIPQVAYSSTSSKFDDRDAYPFFARTCPSDDAEALALGSVIQHFGWQRVVLVYSAEAHGISLATRLRHELLLEPHFELFMLGFPPSGVSSDIQPLIREALSDDYRIFVFIGTRWAMQVPLRVAKAEGLHNPGYALLLATAAANVVESTPGELFANCLGLRRTLASGIEGRRIAVLDLVRGESIVPSETSEIALTQGVYAYDAVWALGMAVSDCNARNIAPRAQNLMSALRRVVFRGGSGFVNLNWTASGSFEILNFVGSFWQTAGMVSSSDVTFHRRVSWPGNLDSPPIARVFPIAVTCHADFTFRECSIVARHLERRSAMVSPDKIRVVFLAENLCGAERAISVAQQAIQHGVIAIVGSMCSSAAIVLSPALEQTDIFILTGDARIPELGDHNKFPNFIRTVPPQSVLPALRLVVELGWRRVTVVTEMEPSVYNIGLGLSKMLRAEQITVDVVVLPALTDGATMRELFDTPKMREARVLVLVLNRVISRTAMSVISSLGIDAVSIFAQVGSVFEAGEEPVIFIHRTANVSDHIFSDLVAVAGADIQVHQGEISTTSALFDAAQMLLLFCLQFRGASGARPIDVARSLRFHGASGLIHFPQSGQLLRNNPIMSETLEFWQRSSFSSVRIASLSQDGLQLDKPLWPDGSSIAPVACPHGTFGVVAPGGQWHECRPCEFGSYAATHDSTECTPCPSGGFCPFASAVAPYRGDWRHIEAVHQPLPKLTLGSTSQDIRVSQMLLIGLGSVFFFFCVVTGSLLTSRFRSGTAAFLKRLDILSRIHWEPMFFPAAIYQSTFGGVLTVFLFLSIVAVVFLIVYSTIVIHGQGVAFQQIPGTISFKPQTPIRLVMQALGIPKQPGVCIDLCESMSFIGISWQFTCRYEHQAHACILEGNPESVVLPELFSFGMCFSQPVFSWQWTIESAFRPDHSAYYVAHNLTAPPGTLLGGLGQLEVSLQPTSFDGDQGYVPRERSNVFNVVTNETFFLPGKNSACLNVNFTVAISTAIFVTTTNYVVASLLSKVLSTVVSVIVGICTLKRMSEGRFVVSKAEIAERVQKMKTFLQRGDAQAHNQIVTPSDTSLKTRSSNTDMPIYGAIVVCCLCLIGLAAQRTLPVAGNGKYDTASALEEGPLVIPPLKAGSSADREIHPSAKSDSLRFADPPPRSGVQSRDFPTHLPVLDAPTNEMSPSRQFEQPRPQAVGASDATPDSSRQSPQRFPVGLIGREAGIAAMQLAMQEVNTQGLIGPWTLVTARAVLDNCSFAHGVEAGWEFVGHNVSVVMGGGCSVTSQGVSVPTAPLEIPVVAHSSFSLDLDNQEAYPFFFRTCSSSASEAAALFNLIVHFRWQRVALIFSDEIFGRPIGFSVRDKLLAHDASSEVDMLQFPVGASPSEIRPLFRQAKADSLRVFAFVGLTGDMQRAVNAAQAEGVLTEGSAILFGTDAHKLLDHRPDLDGVLSLRPVIPDTVFLQRLFASALAHRISLDTYSIYAYESIWALAHALRDCVDRGLRPQHQALREALNRVAFVSVSGNIELSTRNRDVRIQILNHVSPFFVSLGNAYPWTLSRKGDVHWPGGATWPPTARIHHIATSCWSKVSEVPLCSAVPALLHRINTDGSASGDRYQSVMIEDVCGPERGIAVAQQAIEAKVIAIVGSFCSSAVVTLSRALAHTDIVIVSGDATLDELGDSERFPNFLRTSELDAIQPLSDLVLQLGWKRVTMISSDDIASVSDAHLTTELLAAQGVHIDSLVVPFRTSTEDAQAMLQPAIDKASAMVSFVGDGAETFRVLRSALLSKNGSFGLISKWPMVITSLYLRPVIERDDDLWADMQKSAQRYNVATEPDQFFARAYDAGAFLVHGLRLFRDKQRAEGQLDLTTAGLIHYLRHLHFEGASGEISFSRDAAVANDRVQNRSQYVIYSRSEDRIEDVALMDLNGPFRFLKPVKWPDGSSIAPVACPRGTFGVVAPGGQCHECRPCEFGSYAATHDATECTPCPSGGFCPFASPIAYRGDWRVVAATDKLAPSRSSYSFLIPWIVVTATVVLLSIGVPLALLKVPRFALGVLTPSGSKVQSKMQGLHHVCRQNLIVQTL